MNVILTTNAKLKSGGTTSAWFHTNKTKIDPELEKEFLSLFPEIEKLGSLSLQSNKRNKFNLPIYLDCQRER